MTENEVFNAVREIVSDRIDKSKDEVTMESTFGEMGIDSLDTVDLLMDLEDRLGLTIELDKKIATVGDLVSHIMNIGNEGK